MNVTMNIRSSKDPATVHTGGSMTFTSAKGLDEYIRALRIARNWLVVQKAAAPSETTTLRAAK